MRFTLDTNIIFYAFDAGDEAKHVRAAQIVTESLDSDCMLTAQVLAEFLNAIRRKRPTLFADAITKVDQWVSTFPVIDTSGTNLVDAAHFANRHKLQFFDSLIWEVSRSAGAVLFFSEDLQDGFSANGMTVVDPFNPANAQVVAEALLPLD